MVVALLPSSSLKRVCHVSRLLIHDHGMYVLLYMASAMVHSEQGNGQTPPRPLDVMYTAPSLFPHFHLCQELAQLGGGGHETICASVQEHIADTYLIYGGVQSVLSEADKGSDSTRDINHGGGRRRASKASGSNASSVAAAAAVDPESASKRPHPRTSWTVDDNGKVWNTSTDTAQKGRRRSGVKTDKRESALGVEGFQPGVEGQSFPGSSRLSQSDGGGTLPGTGDGKADWYAENLDKAQVGSDTVRGAVALAFGASWRVLSRDLSQPSCGSFHEGIYI